MIEKSKAVLYARECIRADNKTVGVYVKKQAQEWLLIAEGKNEEAFVDEKAYKKICKILKLMVHPDLNVSMYEGLEDYAWFLIVAVFCTKDRESGNRYYTTAILEIARKNFKTFTSGVIFIIAMLTEPKFSRFFSVAPDLKLSRELQLAIKKIIKSSPLLADERIFKNLRSEIRCLLTESEYTPLAYSQDKMDGKICGIFLADECGALDSYPVEAMRSSQITLFNKLGILISTQYPNDDNVLIDEIDIAKKSLDGLLSGTRYFALLYEPDSEYLAGEQWKDNDNIIFQANPVAVAHDYIFDEIKKLRNFAVLYENKRENFLCKHLNIKYQSLGVEAFIDINKVRLCKAEEKGAFWKGKRVYIGLDLSQSDDNTAVAMVCEYEGKIYAKVWGFIPQFKMREKIMKEKLDYKKMIKSGVCFACGDEVIDYSFVERFILELPEKYGVEIMQTGYDRWNAISTVQKLEAAEIECVEVKQHSSVLHMPTKLLYESILKKSFCYDENLLLEINFQNARCTEDTNLNKYVNKKKSAGKVDMVVALINACYLLQQDMLFGQDNFGVQVI